MFTIYPLALFGEREFGLNAKFSQTLQSSNVECFLVVVIFNNGQESFALLSCDLSEAVFALKQMRFTSQIT